MTVGVARYAEAYCDIRRQTPARTIDHEAAQAVGEAFVVLGSRVLEQWARDFDRFPNLPDEKTCKLYYDLACGNLAALRHRGLASGSFSDRDEWFPGGPQAGWMAEQFQAAQGRYAIWRLAFLIRDPWAKETHWRDNEFGGQEGTYEPATYQDRALWADELEAIIGPAAFALGWLPGPIP
jgi:hypothetical protein